MDLANESWCYIVTSFLIGWVSLCPEWSLKPTDTQSSDELRWLDWMTGYHVHGSSNGHQVTDMPCFCRWTWGKSAYVRRKRNHDMNLQKTQKFNPLSPRKTIHSSAIVTSMGLWTCPPFWKLYNSHTKEKQHIITHTYGTKKLFLYLVRAYIKSMGIKGMYM